MAPSLRLQAFARGFTLIELLVVFAIMALMLAVVPVAFDRLSASAKYSATVRALASELRTAHFQAQSEGRDVLFVVRLADRSFGISGATLHAIPEGIDLRMTVAEGIKEVGSSQQAGIRFLPSGGASGGSVEVLRAPGIGIRLRVDWLSGRITQEALLP